LNKDQKNLDAEEEDKQTLIELMKMQNEALKRIYKRTIEKDEKHTKK